MNKEQKGALAGIITMSVPLILGAIFMSLSIPITYQPIHELFLGAGGAFVVISSVGFMVFGGLLLFFSIEEWLNS